MKIESLFYILSILSLSACQTSGALKLSSIHFVDQNGLSQTVSNKERLKSYEKMDFESPQPFKKIACQFKSQKKQATGLIMTYYPSGQIMQLLQTRGGQAHGDYKEWFEQGELHLHSKVIGGKGDLTPQAQDTWIFDGESTSLTQDGQLEASIFYDKGFKEGKSLWYHPNGNIWKLIHYKQDLLEGPYRVYDDQNHLIKESFYQKGLLHGQSKRFWSNEMLAADELYEEGRLIQGCYWKASGEKFHQSVENSHGYRLLLGKYSLLSEQEIHLGVVDGLVKTFDNDGYLVNSVTIKNNLKDGLEVDYYHIDEIDPKCMTQLKEKGEFPPKKLQIQWVQGQIQGSYLSYFLNGKIESQREVYRGKNHGSYLSYYPNGDLRIMEEYENGLLKQGKYWKLNNSSEVSAVIDGKGTATIFDEKGSLLEHISYEFGKILEDDDSFNRRTHVIDL